MCIAGHLFIMHDYCTFLYTKSAQLGHMDLLMMMKMTTAVVAKRGIYAVSTCCGSVFVSFLF